MSYESTHGAYAFDQMVAEDFERDERVAVIRSNRSIGRVALLHADDALHAAWEAHCSDVPMSWWRAEA